MWKFQAFKKDISKYKRKTHRQVKHTVTLNTGIPPPVSTGTLLSDGSSLVQDTPCSNGTWQFIVTTKTKH
jgi:hypothetical protein